MDHIIVPYWAKIFIALGSVLALLISAAIVIVRQDACELEAIEQLKKLEEVARELEGSRDGEISTTAVWE